MGKKNSEFLTILDKVGKVRSLDRQKLLDELARAYQEMEDLNRSLAEANEQKTKLLDQLKLQASDLEQQIREDGLTGLYNRRYLDLRIENEFSRAKRYNRNLAVIMADIDRFKLINDTHSHLVGDEVLKVMAHLFRHNLRTVDFVARYGGEEFVLLLPETPSNGAILVCERIRREIEDYKWGALRPGLAVTMSFGLTCDINVADHAAMLAQADAKLYEAKRGGRNQVRF
ncbi:MAG: diguanylate cyclase [Candidatus Edwardsbacteria bacterium]|jgi:diguanylate cyclase (GGDEF)-like protein|nr:diguanylate cyclase [Candidatus Edwardsbacteria bacterium]